MVLLLTIVPLLVIGLLYGIDISEFKASILCLRLTGGPLISLKHAWQDRKGIK